MKVAEMLSEIRQAAGGATLSSLGINKEMRKNPEQVAEAYRKITYKQIPGDPINAPGTRGVVNGTNVLRENQPFKALGLPQGASRAEIKTAYRDLARVYHPDNRQTGDAAVFNRLNQFYESLTFTF